MCKLVNIPPNAMLDYIIAALFSSIKADVLSSDIANPATQYVQVVVTPQHDPPLLHLHPHRSNQTADE